MKKITFTGSFGEYFGYSILLLLLSIVTFGLAIPYWIYWSMKWFFTKLRIDHNPVIFKGSFGEYFGYSILLMLLSIITFGLAIPYWIYWSYKYFFTKMEVNDSAGGQSPNSISNTIYTSKNIIQAIGYDYINISEEDEGRMEHLGIVEYEDGSTAQEFRIPFKPILNNVFGLLKIKKNAGLLNHIFMHRFLHQVNGDDLKKVHDKISEIYNSDAKIPDHIINSINNQKNEEDSLEEFQYEAKFNLNNKIKTLPYLVFRVNNESGVNLTVVTNLK
jgi:hypothetical protein